MAVTIASDKAKLDIDSSGVFPASHIDNIRGFLFGHLTRGWNGSTWDADALTCTGSVPMTGADADSTELGFVQLAKGTNFKAFYGGRVPAEGGILLDYWIPPALPGKILLDGVSRSGASAARDPWYRNPGFGVAGPRRTADFGDHPGLVTRLQLENKVASNVPNFLFRVIMERDFWTILTARERTGTLHYLTYFKWNVRYEFTLNWAGGRASLRSSGSTFDLATISIIGKTLGRPKEAELQGLLDAPTGDRANQQGKLADIRTLTGNAPNRIDQPQRPASIPSDFWN